MAFTNWSTLKQQILDDLDSGLVLTKQYAVEGSMRTFRRLSEVMDFLAWLDQQIAAESGGCRSGVVRFG